MGVLKKGAICPSCEMGKLGLTKKDLEFTYKNRKTQIKNQDLFKCDLCDYEALSRDDTKRVDKLLTDFRRSVDGLLTSDQLQRIRKSLDCNKKKMARLLVADIQEEICRVMEEQGTSPEELSISLGKEADYITRVMKGEIELTLRTTADIVTALGRHLHVTLEDKHD